MNNILINGVNKIGDGDFCRVIIDDTIIFEGLDKLGGKVLNEFPLDIYNVARAIMNLEAKNILLNNHVEFMEGVNIVDKDVMTRAMCVCAVVNNGELSSGYHRATEFFKMSDRDKSIILDSCLRGWF